MLPFGLQVSNLLQHVDICKKDIWNTLQDIQNGSYDLSSANFLEYQAHLRELNRLTDELNRDAKKYFSEYNRLKQEGR